MRLYDCYSYFSEMKFILILSSSIILLLNQYLLYSQRKFCNLIKLNIILYYINYMYILYKIISF